MWTSIAGTVTLVTDFVDASDHENRHPGLDNCSDQGGDTLGKKDGPRSDVEVMCQFHISNESDETMSVTYPLPLPAFKTYPSPCDTAT